MSALHPLEARLALAQAEGLAANFRRWAAFAGYAPNSAFELELQALKVRARPGNDYKTNKFAHVDGVDAAIRLLEHAERFDCPGLYTLANPLRPGVAARAQLNAWHQMGKGEGTTDSDIAARRVLLIDVDATRPSGTSATDEEMAHASALAVQIYDLLTTILEGDDALGLGHTGNGRMVTVRLNDLAEVDAGPVVRALVETTSQLFTADGARVDTTVTDAKRLLPAWGSSKRKGAAGLSDRPHRRTAFISAPDVVPLGLTTLQMLLETLRSDLPRARGESEEPRSRRKPEARACAQVSSGAARGTSRFTRANAVSIEDVLDRLSLREGDAIRCPGCSSFDGVKIIANGLKCFHSRCASRGTPNHRGFRTVVDVVAEALDVAAPEALARIEEWYGLSAAKSSNRETGFDAQERASAKASAADAPPASAVRNASTPWPRPMEEAAFYGLAGDFVRLIDSETEADRVALLAQTLVFFGNAIGRRAHFVVESEKHFAKLFAVLVGPSAKGRKGTSLARVLNLFKIASPDWANGRVTQAGLSSGEGLIHHVRDSISDEDGETTDPGVSDKRLLVIQTEFSVVCDVKNRQASTLSAVTRQAWDDCVLGTLTKNSTEFATNSHISIVGHITREELRRKLDRTEAANGFANRFLYLCSTRSKLLPFGGGDVDLTPVVDRLVDAIRFGQQVDRVDFDPAAAELWAEMYPRLSRDRWGMAGSITERAEAQTRRIAMIYALLDSCDRIQERHLRAALAFWAYAEESAYSIWGDKSGDDTADEVLLLLRDAPEGVTRTEIRNHFSRHNAAGIGTALKMLVERGAIRVEKNKNTGGRPEERFFAANRTNEEWWRPEHIKGDAK